MTVILCATKHHILDHWTGAFEQKPQLAKSQSELMRVLVQEKHQTPLVFLEERAFEGTLDTCMRLIREINPRAMVMLLSPAPTFHGGQEALELGANGYGNAYLASGWHAEAVATLKKAENWIYPLQETPASSKNAVGVVQGLEGTLFGQEGRLIRLGEEVMANETLMLSGSVASVALRFTAGNTLFVRGMECFCLDESVTTLTPNRPPCKPKRVAFSSEATSEQPSLRPFYINVGKESLIALGSKELEFKNTPSQYISVCPFSIEEEPIQAEQALTFGGIESQIAPKDPFVIRLGGAIEEYEIFYPKTLQGCVLVNDMVDQRDGARVVYAPVCTLNFLDAKVDLFHETQAITVKTKQFGDYLDCKSVDKEKLEGANVVVSGYTQGVDYILFDLTCIPREVRFRYSMDEACLSIHFFGVASRAEYERLLASLRHESSGASEGVLHGRVNVACGEQEFLLFEGLVG